MQKKVWDAAVADSAALLNYYNIHKDKYNWENSADAIIVTCTDSSFFQNAVEGLKNNMKNWRQWAQETAGGIQADSARFELSQIPVPERTNFSEGLITAPVVNQQDNSITFAYIIRLYNGKSPKKFEDAKGTVINDYQMYLEEQWIAELKKKYPLKINRKVFNSLPKTG
jgi:peptidyl-prolyl cis-trans isomerase SurA